MVSQLVFADPSYPGACTPSFLARLIPGEYELVDATRLAAALQNPPQLLISFHGAYFPKECWPQLLHYLEAGGNLAIFGGMPFTRPVRADGVIEIEQLAYTDSLYLGPHFPLHIPKANTLHLTASSEAAFLNKHSLPDLGPGQSWSFYPKLTQTSEHANEIGSAGPFDTLLTPLLYLDKADADIADHAATLVTLLDQQHGRFAGGRWLLSPWQPEAAEDWLTLSPILHDFLHLTSTGASFLEIRPLAACYQPGEAPTIVLTARTPIPQRIQVQLHSPEQKLIETFKTDLIGSRFLQEMKFQFPSLSHPGLYTIEADFSDQEGLTLHQSSGFWLWDNTLVKDCAHLRLERGRDLFYCSGKPFPLFGTTYMDSRVQRKFLAHPNPARWNTDFATFQRAGINIIRTGVWTDWRELMPQAGQVNEAMLRALDAFIMTACRYRIQVIFTFFTFYPPLFEGINPWLDPRSLRAQEDLVTLIAGRYTSVGLLSWDLINEPSFGDPQRIFSERPLPNYDRFELLAFQNWLAKRYTLVDLQVRWRQTPADFASWERVALPTEADYTTDIKNTETRHLLKALDYTHFSQEMFCEWVRTISEAIRASGNQALIGVGQDEAGVRISPQFYASVVDYTTTHPWWNNDELLCDMLLDKNIERPNVIQEIGVMLARDVDMHPWRKESEAAALLERKLITGLIARSAGLIQWLWHANSYMTSENENSIGLVRADGSAKPELAVMREIARMIQAISEQIIESASPPDTWVVVPYGQWFQRPALVITSLRQAVRILGYELSTIPQIVGEHQLPELLNNYQPSTLIVPALQYLDRAAWQALLSFVERGSTLLVSGVIGRDQHNLIFPTELEEKLPRIEIQVQPVQRYEYLQMPDRPRLQLNYDAEKIGYVKKAHNELLNIDYGKGCIFWSGLPIELANSAKVTQNVYQLITKQIVHICDQENPVLINRQKLREGELLLVVSESSSEQRIEIDSERYAVIAPARAGAILLLEGREVQYFGGVAPL